MHEAPKDDLNSQLVLGTPHWHGACQPDNKLARAGTYVLLITSVVSGLGVCDMGISRPQCPSSKSLPVLTSHDF